MNYKCYVLVYLNMDVVMCRAQLSSKAWAWAQLDQAWALKCHEPSLGSRLRLGLAQPGPGLGLEEGTQEMHNGHDKNVLNSQSKQQAAYLQFKFQHYTHMQ